MRKFMSSLAQQITAAGLADHILSERQLGRLLGGGDARRYGLVNRALKDGSLLRVKRSNYLLGLYYRNKTVARKRVGWGKRVTVCGVHDGGRSIQKKKYT